MKLRDDEQLCCSYSLIFFEKSQGKMILIIDSLINISRIDSHDNHLFLWKSAPYFSTIHKTMKLSDWSTLSRSIFLKFYWKKIGNNEIVSLIHRSIWRWLIPEMRVLEKVLTSFGGLHENHLFLWKSAPYFSTIHKTMKLRDWWATSLLIFSDIFWKKSRKTNINYWFIDWSNIDQSN